MPGAGFPLLPLGTDRAYRLRCVEHCAGFAALTALNAQFRPPQPGMEAIMVLPARQNTIDGSGSGVDLLSSSYPVATLWLAAPCGSGWCRDPFAANWELASLNRDQLQGAGTAQSCSYVLCPSVQQRGQLRLLRFPRDLH
jgi:hypothetical protein